MTTPELAILDVLARAAGLPPLATAVAHRCDEPSRAVELVRRAEVGAIMKGSLHADELLGEVVRTDTGPRTAWRISHVFVMQVPGP